MSTQRTDECCEKCKGYSRALGDFPCKNKDCSCHTNDESVVEFDARTFVKKARAQNWKNGGVLCHDDDELIEELESLLTSKDAQHKAEVEKARKEERERFVSLLDSVDVTVLRIGHQRDKALLNVKTVWDAIWPDIKAKITSTLTNKES